jgi:hypothetical protein
MQYGKKGMLLSGLPLLAAFLFLAAGCRSDAYYQDRAVQRARTYLLENAKDLSADQLYFVKFNRPVLLTGEILPAGRLPGEKQTDIQQVCVTWRIPGRDFDCLVFGASSGSMQYWYPNRLIEKKFEKFGLPIQSAMTQARAYTQNYLYDGLSVAEFNRVRFDFPFVIETNFPLVADPSGTLDPEQVEKVRRKLSAMPQLSLVWPLDDPGECIVFCGNGKDDLSGWAINFAGKMKKAELDAATVKVLKTPDNAQTPIEPAEEEKPKAAEAGKDA